MLSKALTITTGLSDRKHELIKRIAGKAKRPIVPVSRLKRFITKLIDDGR